MKLETATFLILLTFLTPIWLFALPFIAFLVAFGLGKWLEEALKPLHLLERTRRRLNFVRSPSLWFMGSVMAAAFVFLGLGWGVRLN